MTTDKNTLLGWFVKGAKPLASQFAAWMNSYWHKDENIPVGNIGGLQAELDKKADADLLNNIDDTKSLIVAKSGLNSSVIAQPIAFAKDIKILSITKTDTVASAAFSANGNSYDLSTFAGIEIAANANWSIDDIDLTAGSENGSINIQFKQYNYGTI